MNEKRKKIIMIIVIILCLSLAGTVAVLSSKTSDKLRDVRGELTWLKCSNKNCLYEYEMDKAQYYQFLEDNKKADNPFYTPPLICPKCSEQSCYKAFKCDQCGKVSFENSVPNDFADRCPHCGHSRTEAKIKSK